MEWIVKPTDPDAPDYDARWAAFDLADLCRLYGVRVVRVGTCVFAVYPPTLEPELVAYASQLLAEARGYLSTNIGRLPILEPTEAVKTLKAVMREHPGLRFCRGEDGSLWPVFPPDWTAGQRVEVQALWFAAGDTLDRDDFMEVEHA